MPRERRRPTRRTSGASTPAREDAPARRLASAGAPAPAKPAWRETIDSFGGFLTIGSVLAAVVIVGAIFVANRGGNSTSSSEVSTDDLMGSAVPIADSSTDRQHIADPLLLQIPPGEPPPRGPHFASPHPTGIFKDPIPDGNAIHSLEHGIVWITYNPAKVDQDTVNKLGDLVRDYAVDVMLSPRPENDDAIDIVSWGQIMTFDRFDKDTLEKFITTNRNRAPEPFVRTTVSM
ncbi:MAG: DUF3105 domain-containing protein [Dehalococcoidia bacterium]